MLSRVGQIQFRGGDCCLRRRLGPARPRRDPLARGTWRLRVRQIDVFGLQRVPDEVQRLAPTCGSSRRSSIVRHDARRSFCRRSIEPEREALKAVCLRQGETLLFLRASSIPLAPSRKEAPLLVPAVLAPAAQDGCAALDRSLPLARSFHLSEVRGERGGVRRAGLHLAALTDGWDSGSSSAVYQSVFVR
jgi:hypothetical protein